MLNAVKMLCLVAFFSLVGCKDILNKPLTSTERPTYPKPLEGYWKTEVKGEALTIEKTSQPDWFQFRWQQSDKVTEGRFVVSYFKRKWVLNIDVASIKIDGVPVAEPTQSAFLLLGAVPDDNELLLIPVDMAKFAKHLSKYFYASPILTGDLCVDKHPQCVSTFSSGKVLIAKRMQKLSDDLVKNYRSIFPRKNAVLFVRQ